MVDHQICGKSEERKEKRRRRVGMTSLEGNVLRERAGGRGMEEYVE